MTWNVCLVTDNEAIQHLFEKTFENRKDVTLKFWNTAEKTFGEVEKNPPHLLIVSINLPDSDGYDLCKALKEKGTKFPILLIEDIFEDIDLDRSLKVKADGFIAKPFEMNLVAEKVFEELNAKKIGNAQREGAEEKSGGEDLQETPALDEEEGPPESDSTEISAEEEEGIVELTELIPEKEPETPSETVPAGEVMEEEEVVPSAETALEESMAEPVDEVVEEAAPLEEEEIPPSITTALEESVSELEKLEAMEEEETHTIKEEKEEIPKTPPAAEPEHNITQFNRDEIEKMVSEIADRAIKKSLEEKLPGILRETLSRVLSDIAEFLK